jgi:8-oxo-dGTP pyrophosphatase MutT (NUDIX family)
MSEAEIQGEPSGKVAFADGVCAVHPFGRMVCFERGGAKFTHRTAAVIIRGSRVLVTKGVADEFWYLPGGRVELLEPAREALIREIREELAVEARVGRLIWIVENFFVFQGVPNHEIGLYFLVDLPENDNVPDTAEFRGCEEHNPTVFRWFDLQDLRGVEIYPAFLREALARLPSTSEHVEWHDPSPRRSRIAGTLACRQADSQSARDRR